MSEEEKPLDAKIFPTMLITPKGKIPLAQGILVKDVKEAVRRLKHLVYKEDLIEIFGEELI